jgi:hypothetical protein
MPRRRDLDEIDEADDRYIKPMKKASSIFKIGMGVTAILGVALIYIYIGLLEIDLATKILYAGLLTICLALVFMGLYSISQDTLRAHEREKRRKKPE